MQLAAQLEMCRAAEAELRQQVASLTQSLAAAQDARRRRSLDAGAEVSELNARHAANVAALEAQHAEEQMALKQQLAQAGQTIQQLVEASEDATNDILLEQLAVRDAESKATTDALTAELVADEVRATSRTLPARTARRAASARRRAHRMAERATPRCAYANAGCAPPVRPPQEKERTHFAMREQMHDQMSILMRQLTTALDEKEKAYKHVRVLETELRVQKEARRPSFPPRSRPPFQTLGVNGAMRVKQPPVTCAEEDAPAGLAPVLEHA